jgi:hypothetical protein
MRRNSDGSSSFPPVQCATGAGPGEFPLGSPASRAAARALLERRKPLTPYDKDCSVLYGCACYLGGHARPDCRWLESTPHYQRGQEISERERGEIISDYLDPESPRRTITSILFEYSIGRLPEPGDVLRYQDVAARFRGENIRAEVETIQRAWVRRLPDTLCPFRCEQGKMLIHQDNGTWKARFSHHAPTLWHMIEDEAFERSSLGCSVGEVLDVAPTVKAVVFIASADGKRRAKPFDPSAASPTSGGR